MQVTTVRASRSIEMSPAATIKWQAVLTEKGLGTAAQLFSQILEVAPEPTMGKNGTVRKIVTVKCEATARKAIKGERLDKRIWESIFRDLKLNIGDFFTAAELYGEIQNPWELLWDLAKDASDRLRVVRKGSLETSGLCDGLEGLRGEEEFLGTVSSGTNVLIKMSEALAGHLILVEQDSNGLVELLAPSCLMLDSELKNQVQRLPQYPPSKFPCLIPLTIGTSCLWAGIFAELPDFEWLGDATQGVLKLQMEQLNDLLEYAQQEQSKATTQILKLSYVVTAS